METSSEGEPSHFCILELLADDPSFLVKGAVVRETFECVAVTHYAHGSRLCTRDIPHLVSQFNCSFDERVPILVHRLGVLVLSQINLELFQLIFAEFSFFLLPHCSLVHDLVNLPLQKARISLRTAFSTSGKDRFTATAFSYLFVL